MAARKANGRGLVRLAAWSVALTLLGVAIVAGAPWVRTYWAALPRATERKILLGFLGTLLGAQAALVVLVPVGLTIGVVRLLRAPEAAAEAAGDGEGGAPARLARRRPADPGGGLGRLAEGEARPGLADNVRLRLGPGEPEAPAPARRRRVEREGGAV